MRGRAASGIALLVANGLLAATVAAGSPAAGAGEPARAPAAAASRPNILIVNTDDQRADSMRWMPKTMAWMSGGTSYPNFRVSIPSCCPSRASFFSGRYPHNSRVLVQSQAANLDMSTTLQHYLRANSYRTAMAGKFLNSWPLETAPPDFERYSVIKNGYYTYRTNLNGQLKRITRSTPGVRPYSTSYLGDRLRNFLSGFESNDAQPWFAYYSPHAPHITGNTTTYAVPEDKYAAAPVQPCAQPGEENRKDKPPYVRWWNIDPAYVAELCASQARSLMSIDDEFDALMTQLVADGELANTLVIFTSDNGYLWGEHNRTNKFTPYEPSVRVPMLMRWDGRVLDGIDNRLASMVDLMPTALDAAGVRLPLNAPSPDGRSLLQPDQRAWSFTEYFKDTSSGSVPSWAMVTNGRVKYIETYGVDGTTGQETLAFQEYYDLANDPVEDRNLLRDGWSGNDPSAQELATLRQVLSSARTCSGSNCP